MNKILLILMCLMLIPISSATITLTDTIVGAGSPNFLNYPCGFDIKGNYAFVISNGDNALVVFDISDPYDIKYVNHVIGNSTNRLIDPSNINVTGDYAYITTFEDDSSFVIFDVSDVYNLEFISFINGSGPSNYLDYPEEVEIRGDYAFVSSWGDVSGNGAISVIDISNKFNMNTVAYINGSNASAHISNNNKMFLNGNYLYIATDFSDSITIYDISDPPNLFYVNHRSGTDFPNYLDCAEDVLVVNGLMFTTSQHYDYTFMVFDLSDPTVPLSLAPLDFTKSPPVSMPCDMAYKDNIIFMTDDNLNRFLAIDISYPSNPRFIEEITGSNAPNYLWDIADIKVVGDYAYMTSEIHDAFMIFDISGVSLLPPLIQTLSLTLVLIQMVSRYSKWI